MYDASEEKHAEKLPIRVIPVTNFPVTLTYVLGHICARAGRLVASRDTEKWYFFRMMNTKSLRVARSDLTAAYVDSSPSVLVQRRLISRRRRHLLFDMNRRAV